MDLRFDPARTHTVPRSTGIYVRAQMPDGRWGNADISQLTTESLFEWLRSRGGANAWAENVVFLLLGHPTQGGPVKVRED